MNGLKHQKEKRSMDHFAGLDVSVNETSVCIVDDTGRIVRETKVASEPEADMRARLPLREKRTRVRSHGRRSLTRYRHIATLMLSCITFILFGLL